MQQDSKRPHDEPQHSNSQTSEISACADEREVLDRDELLQRCLGNFEFVERILDRFPKTSKPSWTGFVSCPSRVKSTNCTNASDERDRSQYRGP